MIFQLHVIAVDVTQINFCFFFFGISVFTGTLTTTYFILKSLSVQAYRIIILLVKFVMNFIYIFTLFLHLVTVAYLLQGNKKGSKWWT